MSSSTVFDRIVAAWRRLDHRLLLNHPRLWTMRFHSAVALGLAAAGLAALVAASVDVRADAVPNVRPFFLSLAALGFVASLYWAILQFRVLRHVSVRGYEGGGRTFALNLACLAAINLAPLAATSHLLWRIGETVPAAQVIADDRAFHQGLAALASYDAERSTFRCRDFNLGGTFCDDTSPSPAASIAGECTQWAMRSTYYDTLSCDDCTGAYGRALSFAPVTERYGCERAATNLTHLAIAYGLGAEETAPSRRHLFLVWFLSMTAAIVLTIVRTTSTRLLVEAAAAIGCTWVVLTFLSAAYDAQQGASEPLVLGVVLLGAPAAVICRLVRPHPALLRLAIAACLLAPAASVVTAVNFMAHGERLTRTDVVQQLSAFASQWSQIDGAVFAAVLGAGTLVTFVLMTLYRPAAQRLAALPARR